MSDKDKINLGIIDLNVNEEKKENKYDFNNMLNKLKRKEADFKTAMIACPFCKEQYYEDALQIKREEERTVAECPFCGSVLKIFKN